MKLLTFLQNNYVLHQQIFNTCMKYGSACTWSIEQFGYDINLQKNRIKFQIDIIYIIIKNEEEKSVHNSARYSASLALCAIDYTGTK